MRQATAGSGHPRGAAARCLRTLLLAVCAVLAVALHHTMPSAADSMPAPMPAAMAAPVPAPVPAAAHGAMATTFTPPGMPGSSGLPGPSATAHHKGPSATAHHDGSGGMACPQAHCTAPDVRLSDFTPPVLPPAAGPCGADGTALAGPPASAPAAGPAPPGPTGHCVLRI